MKKFFEKNLIVSCCIIAIIFALIIQFLFTLESGNKWLVAKWSAGDILTYASTVSLALLAVWQNKRFKEENDKSQARLERIIDDGNRLSIINKIIEYEEENYKRLKNAFENFSQNAEPHVIVPTFTKEYKDYKTYGNLEKLQAAMLISGSKLDSSFNALQRELVRDLSTSTSDLNAINLAIDDYYLRARDLLNHFTTSPDVSALNLINECIEYKEKYLAESSNYIFRQAAKLESMLYSNLTIEQIKQMYHSAAPYRQN